MEINSICVYCGSSNNVGEEYLEAARELGRIIASHKIRLIFGGTNTGIMGAVSESALKAGGEVIGIIPEFFYVPENVDDNLASVEVVASMHARKLRMNELADAFIALPGGFGTMEEMFESITWGQIGIQSKPVGILNINGFYNTLLKFIDELEQKEFVYGKQRNIIHINESGEELVKIFKGFQPLPTITKWVY